MTLRVSNQGDVQSMDPHSLNESLQLSFTGNVYESLIERDKSMNLAPALATKWTQQSPTVWRFDLRPGVKFHDGTPFTADDVVFTFKRAAGEGSDMKGYTNPIKEVRKVGDLVVEIETTAPYPILPDTLTTLGMMSKKWCEDNKAERPVDRRKGIENTASFKANGTGPFRLKERQPSVRTVLVKNFNWWGKSEGNVDEVVFTPIGNDATRVAALLSGETDVMEPVPLQDVERIKSAGINVLQGPELRTIFLGMDQKRDELQFSNVKGKNPFKDVRVRRAFYQAIDEETIKARVMRGAALPTGLMVGAAVRGFQADMNKRLPYDVEAAKKLLADAGYPNGFEVGMNCPNDRYVNDAAICQAVAANLARIGVKVNLMAETKVSYFPKILRRDTSFYLLGWTPSTVDSHDVLSAIIATPNDKGQGQFNLGAYSNPKIDELTLKIQSETDQKKRNDMIRGGLQDPPGRRRPHPAASAGAGLGGEQEGRADPAAERLHVLQVDHREVQVGDAASLAPAGGEGAPARRDLTPAAAAAPSPSRWARFLDGDFWHSFRSSPTAIGAAVVALLCLVAAVFANVIAPHNPFDLATLELADSMLPPSWLPGGSAKYLLGTDEQGRDVLSALMFGARISLFVGAASVLLSLVIGVGLGLVSGYVGGRLDALIMRVCDVMLSFPSILIALLFAGVGHALFPNANDLLGLRRGDHRDRAARLGAVRARRARLDDGRAEQGVRAGRAGDRRRAAADHAAPCAAQRHGPGARPVHHPGRGGDHRRGDALLPRRRRLADVAFARHLHQRRQQAAVQRRLVARDLPGCDTRADRAQHQPVR